MMLVEKKNRRLV